MALRPGPHRSHGTAPGASPPVVVVDDGSLGVSAERVAALASATGATLVRLEVPVGPGGARNAGLERVETDVVAFLDADTVPDPTWLDTLLGHFDDPAVVAVAPRVVAGPALGPDGAGGRPGAAPLLAYERGRSPLDLGNDPGLVGPGRPLRYVPAAALVARVDALRGAGGFDEGLRYGEDVDLVWRLAGRGGLVRYEPASIVEHAVRSSRWALARQRWHYGESAAVLDARHPGAVRAYESSSADLAVTAAVVVALVARRPSTRAAAGAVAVGATAARAVRLARRLEGAGAPRAGRLAATLVVQSERSSLVGLRRSLRRAWWPVGVAGVALVGRRHGRAAAGLAAACLAVCPPSIAPPGVEPGPLSRLALGALDDVAYGTGVLAGCARGRRLGPLLPGRPRRTS